ncbi:hypothetical protein LTR84_001697 [Exophiala bonariae]|uniref:Uncharacterized protein n=1 Tax=Exophiala bonariae TaxID=1690606 RepID=A0AAV9NDR9_9EURO|nr:hypothetical protein LTR84_001697 [Exophiala bonariae]
MDWLSTSKDTDAPVADTSAEQDAERAAEETSATSEAENSERGKGKGKGKEKPFHADIEPQIASDRLVKLAFYECVRQVLENGMRMVGMVPLKT